MPTQYYTRQNVTFPVNVPDGVTPSEAQLDAVYGMATRDQGLIKAQQIFKGLASTDPNLAYTESPQGIPGVKHVDTLTAQPEQSIFGKLSDAITGAGGWIGSRMNQVDNAAAQTMLEHGIGSQGAINAYMQRQHALDAARGPQTGTYGIVPQYQNSNVPDSPQMDPRFWNNIAPGFMNDVNNIPVAGPVLAGAANFVTPSNIALSAALGLAGSAGSAGRFIEGTSLPGDLSAGGMYAGAPVGASLPDAASNLLNYAGRGASAVLAAPMLQNAYEGIVHPPADATNADYFQHLLEGTVGVLGLRHAFTTPDLSTPQVGVDRFAGSRDVTPAAEPDSGVMARVRSALGLTDQDVAEHTAPATQPGTPPVAMSTPLQRASFNPVVGNPDITWTPAGTPVPFHYGVVDADYLTTSHGPTMQPNPAYDQDLQPRDRNRAGMADQVANMSAQLTPERLVAAPTTADGAPLVGTDGQVESGNGRTMAIRAAYDGNLPGSLAYAQHLMQIAPSLGIDPMAIGQMAKPVMVRVNDTQFGTPEARAAFAQEAGGSTVAAMSAPETALADAHRMATSGALPLLDTGAALTSGANAPFVDRFTGTLTPGDRASMLDSEGQLSADGVRRLNGAILASAYSDHATLSRMLDDADPNSRNVGRGLQVAAPDFAAIKHLVASGQLHPNADLAPDVEAAASKLVHLRDQQARNPVKVKGKSGNSAEVVAHLAQPDLLGERNPLHDAILTALDENRRSGASIAALLKRIAEVAKQTGRPGENLFGEGVEPNKAEIFEAARRSLREDAGSERPVFGANDAARDSGTHPPAGSQAVVAANADLPGSAEGQNLQPTDVPTPGAVADRAGANPASPAANNAHATAAKSVPTPATGAKLGSITLSAVEANALSNKPAAGKALTAYLDNALGTGAKTVELKELNQRQVDALRTLAKATDDGLSPAARKALIRKIDAAMGEAPAKPAGTRPPGGRSKAAQRGALTLPTAADWERIKTAFGLSDIKGDAARLNNFGARLRDNMNTIFNPSGMSDDAGEVSRSFRANAGELARQDAVAHKALDGLARVYDGHSDADNLAMIDAGETGGTFANPMDKVIMDILQAALGRKAVQVQALGTGALSSLIQDYFPHIWKDPETGKTPSEIGAMLAKRPLQGSKAFLKQRSMPTTADGIAAGLDPVTTNPVRLTLMKLHEMDKFIMGTRVFQEMKNSGIVKYAQGPRVPGGYAKLDDRIANVFRPSQVKLTDALGRTVLLPSNGAPAEVSDIFGNLHSGQIENDKVRIQAGQWVAPEAAARVFNNYLSPGLRGNALYDTGMAINNALNMAQLGLSLFHMTGTTINLAVSKLASVLELASGGNVASALKTVATMPGCLREGSRIMAEYMTPGTHPGDVADMVQAVIEAGGRAKLDTAYGINAIDGMRQAFAQGRMMKGVLSAPFAALEAVSGLTLQQYVPRVKLAAFADLASPIMADTTLSLDARRAALGKAWDSIDNRFGQLVYDNLFWNKTLRDICHITTRSIGWNLGTVRELGGAIPDLLTTKSRMSAGDPFLTHRISYALALPATVALLGALYGAIHGHKPETIEDYFYPKDSDGQPIALPTYIKDVKAYATRPIDTVKSKMSPILASTGEMLENKDYYGKPIRNVGDPLVQQAMQEAAFVAKQFVPFSAQQAVQAKQKGAGLPQQAERFLGFVPTRPQ